MILFNFEKIVFSIMPLLKSLEATLYKNEIPHLEKKVEKEHYHNQDGTSLSGKRLCTKLQHLLNSFKILKEKYIMQRSRMAPHIILIEVVAS